MSKQLSLELLTLNKLNTLLNHLKNGKEHLDDILTYSQLKELLSLSYLNVDQKETVKSDTLEKAGYTILLINTILTGLAGTWLGAVSFLGLKIHSKFSFALIIVTTAVAGALVGYVSYQYIKEQSHESLIKIKILKLQIKVLGLLKNRLEEKISEVSTYLENFAASLISFQAYHVDLTLGNKIKSKTEMNQWLDLINEEIDHLINIIFTYEKKKIYLEELYAIKKRLRKIISTHSVADISSQPADQNRFNTESPLELLTKPALIPPQTVLKRKSWWRINSIPMVTNLVPTALGGFAFLTIYFDGLPKTASQVGIKQLEAWLTNPHAKLLELTIGLGITFYFAFVHVYNHKKTAQRSQEIQLMQQKINNLESICTESNATFNFLKRIVVEAKKLNLLIEYIGD